MLNLAPREFIVNSPKSSVVSNSLDVRSCHQLGPVAQRLERRTHKPDHFMTRSQHFGLDYIIPEAVTTWRVQSVPTRFDGF